MGCNSCKFLDISNQKEGKGGGTIYYCTKYKKYVNGSRDECDEHEKDYSRKTYDINEIYENGRKYGDDDTSVGLYFVILIILIIILVIKNCIS